MRSFVPCYKVVFSGDVSIGRGGDSQRYLVVARICLVRGAASLQDTVFREFCTGKTRAGGNSVISFKHLSLPPAPPAASS